MSHQTMNTCIKGALLLLVLLLLVGGDPALAQGKNIGDIADNVKGVGDNLGQAAYILLMLVGFVVAGVGVYKVIMAKKTNEPMGLGMAMAIGGSIMLALPLLIDSFTQTAFEQNAKGIDELNINR